MQSRRSARIASLVTFVSLLPALVGLSASAILALDYTRPAPIFCAEGGGCDAIKHTALASFLGIPTPLFGVAGFAAIGVAALAAGATARAAQASLGAFAAFVGVILIAVQLHLGHLCPYCFAADASGVAALLAGAWRFARGPSAAPPLAISLLGGVSLALAAALPLVFASTRSTVVPAVIRQELDATARGQVTVVDFVDFQCPFCRMANTDLEPLIAAHKDRIRLLRRQTPLRVHAHARDAARAACCGEELGQGDAMASALFRTDANELTPEGCEKVAERLGLSLAAYRACVADPATDRRIDADRQEFKDAGGYALPTIWIGDAPFVGAQSAGTLAAALDRALARAGS